MLADDLEDGNTGYWIERVSTHVFKPRRRDEFYRALML
jgi:hypothetical protein